MGAPSGSSHGHRLAVMDPIKGQDGLCPADRCGPPRILHDKNQNAPHIPGLDSGRGQAKWQKLDGANRLPEIVQGVAFKDGIKQLQAA